MGLNPPFIRSPLWRRLVIGLGLCIYLTFGFYTQLKVVVEVKPLPKYLFEDFRLYDLALQDALAGKDAYSDRRVGTGYFYPPPALIFVEIFSRIKPFFLRVSMFWVTNMALLALMINGVGRRYGYTADKVWYWYVLCLGFAPFLELLHIGQINMITLFGIFLVFLYEPAAPLAAGSGLVLAVVTKVTPVVLVWYLLVTKRFRVMAMALVVALVVVALTAWRYGIPAFVAYPEVFWSLAHKLPRGANCQSLVAKLAIADYEEFGRFVAVLPAAFQEPVSTVFGFFTAHCHGLYTILKLYILLAMLASGFITRIGKQDSEPFFIITCLGMMLSPNILWYHHYVFILLPLLIWMGWSRLNPRVVLWCFVGMLIIQIDRQFPPYGLFIHMWAHASLILLLVWQASRLYRLKREPSHGYAKERQPARPAALPNAL